MGKIGRVIKEGGLNVWSHEVMMADVLADAGYVVEFLRPTNRRGDQTPDILLDGERCEMKSPRASNLKAIERNLKIGKWQSSRVILASRRMKGIPDGAIEREIRQRVEGISGISKVKFINRHGEIIDIT